MDYALVLLAVLVVHLLTLISPGPNFLVVTQSAISHTRRTGIFVAMGISVGAALWSSAALIGVIVVVAQFAWLFSMFKILGGIYLLFLGIRLWHAADDPQPTLVSTRGTNRTDWQAFRLGLLTNLTNPKAGLFFGSIFTALLAPDFPTWVHLAAIGIIVVNSTSWHVTLAILFSSERVQQFYRRTKRSVDRATGTALGILGLRLMLPNS